MYETAISDMSKFKRSKTLNSFVASFIGNGKFLTTLTSARGKNCTALCGGHTFAETMFVSTLCIGRLVSTLAHNYLILNFSTILFF